MTRLPALIAALALTIAPAYAGRLGSHCVDATGPHCKGGHYVGGTDQTGSHLVGGTGPHGKGGHYQKPGLLSHL